MSIVILVGGTSAEGNYEHRYLVQAFLDRFGDGITRIITAEPQKRPLSLRLSRMLRRGNYRERVSRALYKGPFGPDADDLGHALFGDAPVQRMPGGHRITVVDSHNGSDCAALLAQDEPDVLVVYGTVIIRPHIFETPRLVTLNMHTGLSPWYRGDSTLFWPIHNDEPDKLGVTVHRLVNEVDGGDIVATGRVEYQPGDTEAEIFGRGVKVGTKLYLDAVQAALDGTIVYQPQDLSLGREYRWIHRTVAAEHRVQETLARWARQGEL